MKQFRLILFFSFYIIVEKIDAALNHQIEKRSLFVTTPDEVIFYLYNQVSPNNSVSVVTYQNHTQFGDGFDNTKETLFIIHGWLDNHLSAVNILVKAAVLNKYDVNVIVVEWSHSDGDYLSATYNVGLVGNYTGQFIQYLSRTFNYPLNLVRLVGHSLGAHVCGIAGKTTQGATKSIIGLDPAAPGFSVANQNGRLAQDDAKYVEVIHTCTALLGFTEPIGDSDYYLNGGSLQTSVCLAQLAELISCSHSMAYVYYAESVRTGGFIGTRCGSEASYNSGSCSNNQKNEMGKYHPDIGGSGVYYLKTKNSPPYAMGYIEHINKVKSNWKYYYKKYYSIL